MEDFFSMNVLERHAELDKPLHDLTFSEVPSLLFGLFDLICKIAHFTKLHDDYKFTLFNKARSVGNNMWMVELTQKH